MDREFSPSAPLLPVFTHRLVLRDFTTKDLYQYGDVAFPKEFFRFLPNSKEDSAGSTSMARHFLGERLQELTESPRTSFFLAVTLKSNEQLIGAVRLSLSSSDSLSASLGFGIHPSMWNHGYATEAAEAVLKFGFERLALRRVEAMTDTGNASAIRVLHKVGMRQVMVIERHHALGTELRDVFLWQKNSGG